MCSSRLLHSQVDPVFEGLSGGPGSLIKYNPLSNLSSAETWNFLRVMVSAGIDALLLACSLGNECKPAGPTWAPPRPGTSCASR